MCEGAGTMRNVNADLLLLLHQSLEWCVLKADQDPSGPCTATFKIQWASEWYIVFPSTQQLLIIKRHKLGRNKS